MTNKEFCVKCSNKLKEDNIARRASGTPSCEIVSKCEAESNPVTRSVYMDILRNRLLRCIKDGSTENFCVNSKVKSLIMHNAEFAPVEPEVLKFFS